mmetsp:Transcript_34466/g.90990  ORF Transcript_34466/g.90990 Transcript_34466/m.90990 type:complete len:248 (+) Transcript_34466:1799-2542(+)
MRGPQGARATALRHSRPSALLQASARARPAWSQPPMTQSSDAPRTVAAKLALGAQATDAANWRHSRANSPPVWMEAAQTSLTRRPSRRRPPKIKISSPRLPFSSPLASAAAATSVPPGSKAKEDRRTTASKPARASQGASPSKFHSTSPALKSAHQMSFMYSRARAPPWPSLSSIATGCRTPPMSIKNSPPCKETAPKNDLCPHGASRVTRVHDAPKSCVCQTSPSRPYGSDLKGGNSPLSSTWRER